MAVVPGENVLFDPHQVLRRMVPVSFVTVMMGIMGVSMAVSMIGAGVMIVRVMMLTLMAATAYAAHDRSSG
jgi:hypothetical protein